jgi:hypothetical protein
MLEIIFCAKGVPLAYRDSISFLMAHSRACSGSDCQVCSERGGQQQPLDKCSSCRIGVRGDGTGVSQHLKGNAAELVSYFVAAM